MADDRLEVVERGYRLLAAGDLNGLLALVHPDLELRPPIAGASEQTVYRGREGLRQYVADIAETWERFDQVPERLIEWDDGVLVILRIEAEGKASGLKLSGEVALYWKFRDGMPHRGIGYTDVEAAFAQLGLPESTR